MRDSIFPVLSCCLSVAWHEQGGDHGPEGVLRSRGVFLESKQWCVTSATEQSLKSGEYWLQGCHTSAFPWPRTVYCLSEHSYVYLTWLIRKLWCCQDTELSLLALQESPSNVGDVGVRTFWQDTCSFLSPAILITSHPFFAVITQCESLQHIHIQPCHIMEQHSMFATCDSQVPCSPHEHVKVGSCPVVGMQTVRATA